MLLRCSHPLIAIYALVVKNVILILTIIRQHLTKSAPIVLVVIDMVTLFKIQNEIIESILLFSYPFAQPALNSLLCLTSGENAPICTQGIFQIAIEIPIFIVLRLHFRQQ